MLTTPKNGGFSVKVYEGDAKTFLAFNLTKAKATNLAGFTIGYSPDGKRIFYMHTRLDERFQTPSRIHSLHAARGLGPR